MNLLKSSRHGGEEILALLDEKSIAIRYETCLEEIKDGSVVCKGSDGKAYSLDADTVLLAVGMRPRTDLVDKLRHAAPEGSVYIVGDAYSVARITEATNGGFQAGMNI